MLTKAAIWASIKVFEDQKVKSAFWTKTSF